MSVSRTNSKEGAGTVGKRRRALVARVEITLPDEGKQNPNEEVAPLPGLHFQFSSRQQLVHDLIPRNHAFQTSV